MKMFQVFSILCVFGVMGAQAEPASLQATIVIDSDAPATPGRLRHDGYFGEPRRQL